MTEYGHCPESGCRKLVLVLPSGLLAHHQTPQDPILVSHQVHPAARWCGGSGELPGIAPLPDPSRQRTAVGNMTKTQAE